MSANKRIRRAAPRTARDLVVETPPVPMRAHDLKKAVHRLEVEIATAAIGRRNPGYDLPPLFSRPKSRSPQKLTYVQARRRRTRWMMQAAMFLTTTCLLAGAAAALYRFWQGAH